MKSWLIVGFWIVASIVLAGFVLTEWLRIDGTESFVVQGPDLDDPQGKRVRDAAERARRVSTTGFAKFAVPEPIETGGVWPRFRGVNCDNVVTSAPNICLEWGESVPKVLWSVDLGEGHAAPVVWNSRVFVLDYDETNEADTLRCFALDDGRELWRRWYNVEVRRNHGMSRTLPAVDGTNCVTIGPMCHVLCVDMVTGGFRWSLDMVQRYGTKVPGWYTGQSPLLDDGCVVLAPAGTNVFMVGVDCATGKTLWETPNAGGWVMSHSSVMPWRFGGKRMYVYAAVGGIVGVSAEGADRGKVLWSYNAWEPGVVVPSPVLFDDGRIFLTAGYAAGGLFLRVTETGGLFSVSKLKQYKPKDGLCSEQQTPVLHKGLLYGIQPKDAGLVRCQFVCYDPERYDFAWTSGKSEKFGIGPYLLVGDKFLVLDDDGVLSLVDISGGAFKRIARKKVMDGKDTWGPLALVGTRLLMRDDRRMICLDLGAGEGGR